jgi:ribosome-associated protein YbcJ (S4-like RNA binding protein)
MWMADGEVMVNGHGELVMGNSQEKDGKVKIYDQKKVF